MLWVIFEEEGRCSSVTYITTGIALTVSRVTLFSVPTLQPLNHSDNWNSTDIVEAGLLAQKMTPSYKLPARTICRTRNNGCNEVGGRKEVA
jgi:hypothetical protein